jgi:DNA-binding CsgD family transcriptional regulator
MSTPQQRGPRKGAIGLGPSAGDAVADFMADILHAVPDADLLSLADGAAGNLQLLVALVEGLCEEGAVVVANGRARLDSARLPQRVHAVVRDWLEQLSPEARNVVEVAAVLGRTFEVEDLARVYGRPVDQLLAPIREIVECDLVITVAMGARAFRHDLVRESIAEGVPAAVRSALSSHAQQPSRRDRGSAPGAGRHPSEDGGAVRPTRGGSPDEATAVHDERRTVEGRPGRVDEASLAWATLTDTEQAVAGLVCRGLTNREVAERVFLSPHTVSFHLRKVYRKLGVRSRVELARFSFGLEERPHSP